MYMIDLLDIFGNEQFKISSHFDGFSKKIRQKWRWKGSWQNFTK